MKTQRAPKLVYADDADAIGVIGDRSPEFPSGTKVMLFQADSLSALPPLPFQHFYAIPICNGQGRLTEHRMVDSSVVEVL